MLLSIAMDSGEDLQPDPQREEGQAAADHQRQLDAWRELWGQYKAVTDAFDGMIYICSPAYEIEFVNRHLAEMLGYSPLGQKCHRILYNLDYPCPWCFKDKVLRGETVRQKSVNPHNNRTYYQVATPFYHKGEALMMTTIEYLPANCPIQMIAMEPGTAPKEEAERNVA